MDAVLDCALRVFVATRKDLFGEGATFLRFESEQDYHTADGFRSRSVFGRIVCSNQNTCETSPPLMLKMMLKHHAPLLCMKLEFINEIFFYTQLVPFFSNFRSIKYLFPEFYNSQISVNQDDFSGVIIQENLQASAFETSSINFLDFDHLSLMMRKLGEFHAYSYKARKIDLDNFLVLVDSFKETSVFLSPKCSGLLPILGLRALESLRNDTQYAEKFIELSKLIESSTELMKKILCEDKMNPIAVLCHGDYLRTNVLFKYNDAGNLVDLKMVDMANCKLTSPVVDLAHVLYLNANQKMRDEHWDDLLNEYYTALRNTFPENEVPSINSILAEFRIKALIAYFVASYFLYDLMAADYDLPRRRELLPKEYKTVSWSDIPWNVSISTLWPAGGDELLRNAFSDILKDMISRGFV